VGYNLAPASIIIGASGAILSNLLSINPTGSVGTLEAGWVLGFTLVDLEAAVALASGLLFHGLILAYSAIAALLSYLWLRRRRRAAASVFGRLT